jgi:hypothetical protein
MRHLPKRSDARLRRAWSLAREDIVSCHERTKHVSGEWVRRQRWMMIAAAVIATTFAARLNAQTPDVPQPQAPMPVPMPQQPSIPQQPPIPQQPVIPQPPQPIIGYRSPAIALVQPGAGEVLAQDKAVLIFRFVQGESADPLDASSFGVWVNGSVRTASFQVGATEAWGPLSDSHEVTPGAYQVTARICSTRGACGTTTATVTVASSEEMPSEAGKADSRRQRIIDLLLAGLRRLIGQ